LPSAVGAIARATECATRCFVAAPTCVRTTPRRPKPGSGEPAAVRRASTTWALPATSLP
jgi:hypothetical protein